MKNKDQYFQHDYNAYNDPKIVAFTSLTGAEGYGVYWRIVEMLHSSDEWILPKVNYIYISLAKQMSTSVEQIKTIINYAIECELFIEDEYCIWSKRVCQNMDKRNEISEKRSKAGKISALKRTSVEQVLTSVEQNPTKESKVKESKINIKEKKKKVPKKNTLVLPEWFDSDIKNLIKDFKEHRVKLKKPMTDKAVQLLVNNVIKMSDKSLEVAKELLEKAIEKGWLTIYPLNAYKSFGNNFNTHNNPDLNINITTWDNLLKAITENMQGKGIHIGNLLEAVKTSNSKGFYENKSLNDIYRIALKMSDRFKIKKKEHIKPNAAGQQKIAEMIGNAFSVTNKVENN